MSDLSVTGPEQHVSSCVREVSQYAIVVVTDVSPCTCFAMGLCNQSFFGGRVGEVAVFGSSVANVPFLNQFFCSEGLQLDHLLFFNFPVEIDWSNICWGTIKIRVEVI